MGQKCGFVGLGQMGKPMAMNLVEKGFDLTVFDLRPEPAEELKRMGAKVARSAKELGAVSDFVVVMVRDIPQAEAVILGKGGVLEGAKKGSVILITSTVDPPFCRRTAKIAAEKGVGVLDTGVSGARMRARNGTLSLLVGGEKEFFAKAQNVLEAMGDHNIFHVGGIGMGQVAKLANNAILHGNWISTYEGILLATKAGIDKERFMEIARASTGNSWALQEWYWRSEDLKTSEVRKDRARHIRDLAVMMQDLAEAEGLQLPLRALAIDYDWASILENQVKESDKEKPDVH